jgi:hypothetical protein
MAGIRLSSPATHLNRSNELGAGEGNRTLDIQLGKLDRYHFKVIAAKLQNSNPNHIKGLQLFRKT